MRSPLQQFILQALDPSLLPRENVLSMIARFEQARSPEQLEKLVVSLAEWIEQAGEPGLVNSFRAWITLMLAQRIGRSGRTLELDVRKEEEAKMTTLLERARKWGEERDVRHLTAFATTVHVAYRMFHETLVLDRDRQLHQPRAGRITDCVPKRLRLLPRDSSTRLSVLSQHPWRRAVWHWHRALDGARSGPRSRTRPWAWWSDRNQPLWRLGSRSLAASRGPFSFHQRCWRALGHCGGSYSSEPNRGR